MHDPRRDKFIPYAIDAIEALKTIASKYSGKNLARLPIEYQKYSKSYIDSILIGLGNEPKYKSYVDSLVQLLPNALTREKIAKHHFFEKLSYEDWMDQSSGLGDKTHPVNRHTHHLHPLKVKLENVEMAQSDIHKIIKYSSDIQQLFSVQDNLEDWVKAKLNHACDYVATVRDYLKFYRDEKQAGTPDEQIDEKWTNKYKKSINCSNPKGFSQKAHCRARKLRRAGQHTSSKPVREVYKKVTNDLLKEFNSSMAMGALKQLHSDAEELSDMLTPDIHLEDWVKAKLNLAGEYLDDVYHHLDYFGSQGRSFDETNVAKKLQEGWKDWVAAGAVGLSALTGGNLQAAPQKVDPVVTQQASSLDQSFVNYIKSVENAAKTGYDSKKKLWYPHKSSEGGRDTIGYGHKIHGSEDFSNGITDSQAEALLRKDLQKAQVQVNKELGGRQLSKKQMEMFVDFVFNMGTLSKFPKFTQAVLKNDVDSMKQQYKRYASGKELKGRNSAFLQRFLNEYFGFNYYF